jgi:hypothetical protein
MQPFKAFQKIRRVSYFITLKLDINENNLQNLFGKV